VWAAFTSNSGCTDKWGVWVTEDAGQTWQEANKGLGHCRLSAITVDPKDPDVPYVGTYGVGVFRGTFSPEPQAIRPTEWPDFRASGGLEAQTPRKVRAQYSREKIVPDGKFSEPVWQRCGEAGGFFGYPYPKKPVDDKQQTSFSVCYDNESLAVRVRCRLAQPLRLPTPSAPAKHDGPAWRDEGIELFIETRLSNEFECVTQLIASCTGEKADIRYFGAVAVMEWDAEPMWDTVVAPREGGYEILFRVPFKALETGAPAKGDGLRLKVCRNPSLSSWTSVGYMSPLRDFGWIEF
jgi:hypothetical protein